MDAPGQSIIQEKLDYLDTLKFTASSRTSKKRKDNPIEIKYEEKDPTSNLKKNSQDTESQLHKDNRNNFQYIFDKVKEMRKEKNATVDTCGCHTVRDPNDPIDVQDFQLLIALIISVQNREESTHAAVGRLKEYGLSVENLYKTSEEKILEIIGGVNFNKTKARYIKKAAEIIMERYDKKVPSKWQQLLTFPGVGNKIAVLQLNIAHNMNVGIGVDTHVHRIANRLGLARSKSPDQTRVQMEAYVPKEDWSDINQLFVGFGQQICNPITPKCHTCLLNDICPEGKKRLEYIEAVKRGDIQAEVKVTKKRKTTKNNEVKVKEEKITISLNEKSDTSNETLSRMSTRVSEVPASLSPIDEDTGVKKKVERRQKTL